MDKIRIARKVVTPVVRLPPFVGTTCVRERKPITRVQVTAARPPTREFAGTKYAGLRKPPPIAPLIAGGSPRSYRVPLPNPGTASPTNPATPWEKCGAEITAPLNPVRHVRSLSHGIAARKTRAKPLREESGCRPRMGEIATHPITNHPPVRPSNPTIVIPRMNAPLLPAQIGVGALPRDGVPLKSAKRVHLKNHGHAIRLMRAPTKEKRNGASPPNQHTEGVGRAPHRMVDTRAGENTVRRTAPTRITIIVETKYVRGGNHPTPVPLTAKTLISAGTPYVMHHPEKRLPHAQGIVKLTPPNNVGMGHAITFWESPCIHVPATANPKPSAEIRCVSGEKPPPAAPPTAPLENAVMGYVTKEKFPPASMIVPL